MPRMIVDTISNANANMRLFSASGKMTPGNLAPIPVKVTTPMIMPHTRCRGDQGHSRLSCTRQRVQKPPLRRCGFSR